jgi:hypothetical protein
VSSLVRCNWRKCRSVCFSRFGQFSGISPKAFSGMVSRGYVVPLNRMAPSVDQEDRQIVDGRWEARSDACGGCCITFEKWRWKSRIRLLLPRRGRSTSGHLNETLLGSIVSCSLEISLSGQCDDGSKYKVVEHGVVATWSPTPRMSHTAWIKLNGWFDRYSCFIRLPKAMQNTAPMQFR